VPGWAVDGVVDTINAIVTDSMGNPVAEGTAVYFFTNSGSIIGSDVTDSSGFAQSIWYSSDPRPPGGVVIVSAETRGAEATVISDTTTFFSTYIPDSLWVDGVPDSINANTSATKRLTVHAVDLNGNPVVDMTEVEFSTDLGTVEAFATTSGECTDSRASATYTSTTLDYDRFATPNDLRGDSVVVNITSGDASVDAVIYLMTGDPSLDNSSINAPGSMPYDATVGVTVVVKDVWGNPLGGEEVSLSADIGTVSGSPDTTNSSGVASFEYTSPGSGTLAFLTATISRTGDVLFTEISLEARKAKRGEGYE